MAKVRVSFTGKDKPEVWAIETDNTVGEPHLLISRHSRELALVFESIREHQRYYAGVRFCRAKYEEDGILREVYVTQC